MCGYVVFRTRNLSQPETRSASPGSKPWEHSILSPPDRAGVDGGVVGEGGGRTYS
jgi:hypothetical protein